MYTKDWYNEEFKGMQEFMEPANDSEDTVIMYFSFFLPYLCGKYQQKDSYFCENGFIEWMDSLTDKSMKEMLGFE